jgi:hypothetical protein
LGPALLALLPGVLRADLLPPFDPHGRGLLCLARVDTLLH